MHSQGSIGYNGTVTSKQRNSRCQFTIGQGFTRGSFMTFICGGIIAIRNSLNEGILPNDFYALAEEATEGPIPGAISIERRVDVESYAARATRVAVFHVSGDRVVAYIEIVSPGNKHSEVAMRSFTDKLGQAIRRGCHALVIDVHPPTRRDPRGMHARFWQDSFGDENGPGVTAAQPLGMSAYRSDLSPTAYFEPFAVGDTLIDMPVFLTPDRYVNLPLAASYDEAWRGVPKRWKQVVEDESRS